MEPSDKKIVWYLPSSLTERVLFLHCHRHIYSISDVISVIVDPQWDVQINVRKITLNITQTYLRLCFITVLKWLASPRCLLVDHHGHLSEFPNSQKFSMKQRWHWICAEYGWACLPVFRPNVGEISITAFRAAIGRAALLFTEAACPPIAGISANHWPSWSHGWLI